ncbi:MAG: hypothetical protein INF74_08175 [Roseomonas sp.]|nr:hypothetical protein [Roseomonas sp.]
MPLVEQLLVAEGASERLHQRRVGLGGDSPAPAAQYMTQRRGSRGHPLSEEERAKNATESRVRAKGEHPLLIIKRIFGFTQVRYRGLAKNGTRFEVLCALANLYMKRRVLMRYCHA